MTDHPAASDTGATKPPGWYRGAQGKRYWDGQAWTESEPKQSISGAAVAAMVLGIVGLLVGINALFKARIFLGYVDVFGPVVLGILAVVLALVAGKRSLGFRLAGFICGGLSLLLGILIIAAI